jgi:LDH2 family malate/lactate/ureidoglycolate dehydrogenase
LPIRYLSRWDVPWQKLTLLPKRFRSATPVDGQESVLVPGDPERVIEKERINAGFDILKPVENDLKALAEKFEIEF